MTRFMKIGEFRVGQIVRIAKVYSSQADCKVGMQGKVIDISDIYIDVAYENNTPYGLDSWLSYYENYEFELIQDVFQVGDKVRIDEKSTKKENKKQDMPVKNAEIKTEPSKTKGLKVGDKVRIDEQICSTHQFNGVTFGEVIREIKGYIYGVRVKLHEQSQINGVAMEEWNFWNSEYYCGNIKLLTKITEEEYKQATCKPELTIKDLLSQVKFIGDSDNEIFIYTEDGEVADWISEDELYRYNDYIMVEINVSQSEIQVKKPRKDV